MNDVDIDKLEEQYETCSKCGHEMWYYVSCPHCGGEGGHYPAEIDPIGYDEDEFFPCDVCDGLGGWHTCLECHPEAFEG